MVRLLPLRGDGRPRLSTSILPRSRSVFRADPVLPHLYGRLCGPAAPLMLTSLRFLQGIGVGGEWGGAVLLALEYGHRGKRGFYASWPQAGVPLGLLTSAGVVAVFENRLSPADFLAWGWRVPFLLSGLLVVVGLLIRVRILETPLFRQWQQARQVAHAPVRETLRR